MKKLIWLLITLITLSTPLASLQAATFNPNLILSDDDLTNYTAMNLDQVKNFLKTKGSILWNYVEPNVRMYAYQIIYEVTQLYKINPKYILTLLQKEQSLITDPAPSQSQLDWASGYGCPDSGGCNEKYKGLANQIDWGAGGTRYYLDHPEEFKYQVGQVYTIDGESVTILNDATRTLYVYTPHLHGNKNLHTLWNNWFAIEYPDGALLQNITDGGIWLIQSNKRRPFLTKSAFASRYSFNKVIKVKQEDLEKYESGAPIKYANYSLLRIPTGGIYLLEDDKLRPITSMKAFRLIGFNPEEVTNVKEAEIADYERGEPISVEASYPTGGLVQDKKTGGVYYIKNGVKYPLWDKILIKLYYKDKKIQKVSPDELEKYNTGLPIKLNDGELAKAPDSPAIYFISNGLKRPIANAETFDNLGYQWKNIIEVSAKILNLHPIGEEINVSQN